MAEGRACGDKGFLGRGSLTGKLKMGGGANLR